MQKWDLVLSLHKGRGGGTTYFPGWPPVFLKAGSYRNSAGRGHSYSFLFFFSICILLRFWPWHTVCRKFHWLHFFLLHSKGQLHLAVIHVFQPRLPKIWQVMNLLQFECNGCKISALCRLENEQDSQYLYLAGQSRSLTLPAIKVDCIPFCIRTELCRLRAPSPAHLLKIPVQLPNTIHFDPTLPPGVAYILPSAHTMASCETG